MKNALERLKSWFSILLAMGLLVLLNAALGAEEEDRPRPMYGVPPIPIVDAPDVVQPPEVPNEPRPLYGVQPAPPDPPEPVDEVLPVEQGEEEEG